MKPGSSEPWGRGLGTREEQELRLVRDVTGLSIEKITVTPARI